MSIKKTILAFCTLILVTVAVFFLFLHPIDSDGDFYHHLIIGRYVADLRALPYTDTFTYTAAGHPYIGYAWGTGVLFYVIFRTFGAEGISLFVALVGVLTCGLLWVLTREFHLARSVRILLILLAAGVLATRWPTRPEIMTYPGLLAILVVNRIRRHHPQATLLFPVIVFLWANLYSVSLIAGLGILLLIGMFELVNARPKRQTKLLWWNIAAAIGAAWINGYGYR
ncbi:MAG: hypothetical protein NT149_02110, partial [Candidatus Gottesmanbacteria bacterium]|nr:hypothetical protein [Candidatus Gottesmanbacteria bacterium]